MNSSQTPTAQTSNNYTTNSSGSNNFNSDVFREEAIPFVIYNNELRKFEINEEVQEMLRQMPGPIGVVSVAGMYRTGKSYLLNRMLLNRSGGFGVGPTINPCTKGIWIWGKPIQGFTPEGEPINVLVMDTEGLGALDEDSNHDVRIFSLAILISSYFLYNSVGSIDENALSNLSLVINLTKHIHLRAQGVSQEEIDPEEYSQYFPSFMWVVRDFALQLVDQEGEPITSKEYLEKALQPQKGFSDGVEQKNRIRRLLKSFFKERDCCTMIRPLTKEENLQSLEKMQLEDLRPEFVEQFMQLRRKVIQRIRPKLMHGKKLSGDMLYNLAGSYVDAINRGVVPNIETAWSYICKSQCLRAQQDAYERFERAFQESFELRAPVFEEELSELYREAKKSSLEEFQKTAVGDVSKSYMVELKDKMKHKFKLIKQENEKIAEQQQVIYLQQTYISIERKLKDQQYGAGADQDNRGAAGIYEYVDEMQKFQQFALDNMPPGPNRNLTLSEFCLKALAEASEFLVRTISNELLLQRKIAEEAVSKFQGELRELKEENRAKIDFFEGKLRALETERAEAQAKEQSLRESLAQVSKEKEHTEQEMAEQIEAMRRESARQLEEARNRLAAQEEQAKDNMRTRMAAESEFDKQKALLEQKVEFLERQLEEAQRKEKELSAEVKNQKRDHFNSVKDIQGKLEQQIKDLNKRVEEQCEQLFEWESKCQDAENKLEQATAKFEDAESTRAKEISKLKETLSETQRNYDSLKKKYSEEIEQLRSTSEEDSQARNEKIRELETAARAAEESLEIARQRWEKDQAIYKQKQEFLELQLKEERNKYEEQRQAHEQIMRNIQNRERESVINKEEASKRMQEIKEMHSQEYQELEAKYETERKRLTEQIDILTERNSEIELSLKAQLEDALNETQALREQLVAAEEVKNKAVEQAKMLEAQKSRMVEESEDRAKSRYLELERELEDKTREFEESLAENQTKSEEQLQQLKSFFEIERDRLERRLQEERERAQKRYNAAIEDYEQKIREEQQRYEEDIQMVQDEAADKERQLGEYITQLEHENSMRQQQIDTLEAYLAETKEALNKSQETLQAQIEQLRDKANEERRELIAKVEKSTAELTRKERQITTLENQKESLIQQMQQREKALQDARNEMQTEKAEMNEKIETLRAKNSETLDELTQKKIEFERDRALKTQQLQFQDQRITELTRQVEETIKRYEERLRTEREDLIRDSQDKVTRITQEKEAAEQKYDQKRKAHKELEANLARVTATNERERAILTEKCSNLENQLKEAQKNAEAEITRLNQAIDQLQLALSGDKALTQEELEKKRKENAELERQNQDLINTYDREKALWEGKFKFLEQQRDTAKKDYEDAQRNFQTTLDRLSKNASESKQKLENAHSLQIIQLETKHQQLMKEVQERTQVQITELQARNKELEREKKILLEKSELQSKSKLTEQGTLEKRLEKALESEARLQEELDSIKAERDSRYADYQRQLDKERENYKLRLKELDGKGTSAQARQTEQLLTFEKERAKWEQEKSYLLNQKDDAVEAQQRLEKKVESLLRENEKLKNDLRANRKNMFSAGGGAGIGGGNGPSTNFHAAMVGKAAFEKYAGGVNKSTVLGAGFGAGIGSGLFLNKGDGSGTDRSTYHYPNHPQFNTLNKQGDDTKNFTSPNGGTNTHGAVSALNLTSAGLTSGSGIGQQSTPQNPLETSYVLKNILSTPSSKSGISTEDALELQKHQ